MEASRGTNSTLCVWMAFQMAFSGLANITTFKVIADEPRTVWAVEVCKTPPKARMDVIVISAARAATHRHIVCL